MARTLESRTGAFWTFVDRRGPQDCWEWLGFKVGGYGKFRWDGGQLAHRFSYELANGPIPEGITLDHLCRNRGCVNPAHLEAVPIRTNTLRGTNFIAEHARKTHCHRGHPLSGDNVRIEAGPHRTSRRCKTCKAAYDARRYAELGPR
jgi:HNH endonuclease